MAFLEVDLVENGNHSFESISDLVRWFDEDYSFWTWLSSLAPEVFRPYQEFHEFLRPFRPELNAPRILTQSDVDRMKAKLAGIYSNRLHHASPKGAFVQRLAKESQKTAAGALAIFYMMEVPGLDNIKFRRGMMMAHLYEAGIDGTIDAKTRLDETLGNAQRWWDKQQTLLTKQEADFSKASEEHRKQLEAMRDENRSMRSEYVTTLDGISRGFNDTVATFNKSFAEKTKELDGRMDAIADTYNNKMALQAPVKYWTDKQAKHKNLAIGFGIAFGVCMALTVGVILLMTAISDSAGHPFIAPTFTSEAIPFARIVIVGLLVTVCLWVSKTAARLFLSNLHLHIDASERVTIVHTYLALLKDNHADKDQLRLALEQVFRHASTGIVKDDANPPLLASLINRGG